MKDGKTFFSYDKKEVSIDVSVGILAQLVRYLHHLQVDVDGYVPLDPRCYFYPGFVCRKCHK